MKEKIFNVPNITCQHCVHTIKMELSELKGIQNVTPDAVSKEVKVIFDEQF